MPLASYFPGYPFAIHHQIISYLDPGTRPLLPAAASASVVMLVPQVGRSAFLALVGATAIEAVIIDL